MLTLQTAATRKEPNFPRFQDVDLSTSRNRPAPFVIYADFESIENPVDENVDITQGVDVSGESSSHVFQEHASCSFAYKVVNSVDPNFSRPLVIYRGEDAIEKFVRDLQQEAKQLFYKYIKTPKPMLLTATELLVNYRGTAHNECNLIYRISKSFNNNNNNNKIFIYRWFHTIACIYKAYNI